MITEKLGHRLLSLRRSDLDVFHMQFRVIFFPFSAGFVGKNTTRLSSQGRSKPSLKIRTAKRHLLELSLPI